MWLWSLGHTSSSFFPTDAVSFLSTPTICYDDGSMDTRLVGVYAPITSTDTEVTLDITVKALVNVIEISHMLVWNHNVLSINRSNLSSHISNIAPLLGLSIGNFASTTDSTLNFNWVRFSNTDFQSLPDDAILYSIRFNIIGTIGNGTLVREFPENERPLPLSRPENKISTSNGSSRMEIPYTGVNTLITTGITPNSPPTVSITSPFNGQTFTTGTTLNVQANASDSDGFVTGVELFYDGVSQGTVTNAPYQWAIPSLAAGTHTLQVVATDDDNATTSQTISITVVTPNVPPSVTITSPSNGQNFTQGTPIVVNANASDSDGFVTGVELFIDNVSFGLDTNAPYQWTISNAAVGSRNLRVVATDNGGLTAQAAINVTVNAPNNVAPTVAFTSPLDGQSFIAGNNLTVTATANDSDGSITGVELIYNGMSQSIDNVAPYQWSISSLSVGTKTLQVIATDNNGATAQQTITITVTAGGGSTNPDFPAPVSTCALNRTVNASDTIVALGTYQVEQDIVTNGNVAIDNTAGIVFQAGNSITLQPGFSAQPTSGGFFIARIEPCTTINNLPVVDFIRPFNNGILDVNSDMVVQASASDPYGYVVSVQLFYDGILQGTDNLAPYQWVVPNLTAGTHTLRVVATDNEGATAEQIITITVSDINDAPIVEFTQPLNGDTYDAGEDLMVTATASDNDGTISSVEFYYDGILQGTDNLAPYQWMLFGLAPGTHTLRVVATDNEGATSEDVITIAVTNSPPTIAFATPDDGEVFSENEVIEVEAIANDSDGTISAVTFYLDGVIQGIDNNAPYTWTLSGLSAGTYTLRLVAEDNSGAQAEVTRIIQVSAPSNPPVVNFLAPLDGNIFNAGINLNVRGIANDSDGTVARVAFYYDNILQGTDFAAPYSWVVFNLQSGLHTLRLVATDNSGATDEAVITISVNNVSTFNQSNDGVVAALNTALYSTATVLAQQMNDPPVVTISTPMDGQQFNVGDDLTVQASATDADGTVRNIRMQFDGETQSVITGSSGTWDAFSDPDLANLQAGMHTIRVIAVDNNGTIGDLIYTINVVQVTNTPPTVSIDFPVDGGVFTAGTTINVTASASDTDGTVTGVEFFFDGNSQGVDDTAPYGWTLNNVSAGTYTLRAVATDDDNDTTQDEITITVNPAQNNAPTVSINAPLDGESFTAGTNIGVQVSASDNDGTVTGVELFFNGASQGVDGSSPYSWTLPSVNAGNYTLRAVATDNDGTTAQDEISISVNAASNSSPTVSIDVPLDGESFTQGTTISIQASASDNDGSVTGVELFVDGNSRGTITTAPYTWSVSNLSTGNRTLRVVATDDDTATAEDEISVTVNQATSNLPIVSFVRPNDGQTFPVGSDVIVEVNATSSNGTIQYVDLFLDGNLVRREGQPPYEWGKPTQPDSQLKNMAAGTYTLEAVATDNQNNTGSATISFTISGMGGGGGNMSPTIAFQTPTDGDNFGTGETINILVAASDSDGSITGVQLFANGQNQGTDNTAPYEWTLSTNNPGTYTLRAVATDDDGATSEQSIMITITDGGGGGNGNAPVVSFVTPMDGETFIEGDDVPVEVSATDDGSVQFVDLFLDGTLVRRENGAPYEWGLPTQMDAVLQNMSPGTYTLEAVATDNQGNTGSATITFIVNSLVGTPPSVIFVVPTDGQNFTEGTNINVQANATDTDGTVTSVELFVDGVSEGIDNSDPYTWTLSGLAIGSYTLRLVATDNDSRTAQTEITINVTAGNPDDPVVSFVMPMNGQDYPVGSDVVVEVNATDNQRVDFVDLFVDGVFYRRENTAPYEWGLPIQMDVFFANMSAGTYNLEAVATDNRGNTGSAAIFFTVGGGGGTTNIPPTVSITSPTDGDSFSEGDVVTVNATASDSDGTIDEVELFVDNVSQGTDMTAPYSWDLTGLGIGSYTLRVVATDDDNATAEDMIGITVDEAGTCATNLTFNAADSPIASGTYQASQNITTNGQVSPMPAASVIFQAGNSITLNPGFSTSPTSGSFTARIRACAGGTNTPPMVNFTSPNDGQSFTEGNTINVQASASDSDGMIAQVELFMDGVSQGTDASAPYQWAVTGAAVGNRTLRVVATDEGGETAEATITIQVNAMNTAGNPVVTFVTPTNGQTFAEGSDVPVEVNATDSNGSIDFIDLFLNGTLVRRENLAPFQWGFPGQNDSALTNLAAGTYTLEAVATDNQGNTGSSTISITVTAGGGNTPPQVSFSAPTNGQTFVEGDNVSVTVAASDSDGSVSTVELFYDGVSQGTDDTSPYTWTINNTVAGSHTLRAVSTDDEGATSETTISINATSNTSNSNARIAIENRTRTPFRELPFPSDTVYSFCNVRNWVPTMTDLHNRNTMRIHNEGTDDLIISNIEITDQSEFTLPGGELSSLPIIIAPNSHYDLLIQFIETEGSRGVRKEIMNITSNAANKPVVSVSLRGAFHVRAEGNNEPKIDQILEVLGFQTRLGSKLNSGRYPTDEDVANGVHGDIVVSKVWERADPNEPVIGFNLATYIGAAQDGGGNSNLNIKFVEVTNLEKVGRFSFDNCSGFNQSILSKSNNCVSYDFIAGREDDTVDQPFRIVMDGYITDGQQEVEPATGNRRLLGIRMYKVIDNAGNEVPNHYIGMNDYVKNGCTEADGANPDDAFANCDWNDNVVYFVNIRPAADPRENNTLGAIEARSGAVAATPSLRAYPNPAQDELTVDLSGFAQERVTLRLQNRVGQVVYQQTFDVDELTTERIDLATYSNGLYILSLQTDQVQLTQKVVVNKTN
jgi:hypothetical protein